ncbi:alpha-N-acetylgalactosaminide alpha-2,6-sialyltransferase 3 isoform X3 [Pteropus vampyrus]|uniref:Alpha-N-acetylgalactosaminide alpha-2,6-sialyltransferase 3 isoform X3 n=1 Tax=Pteropus vampyrus TaxID=132908 RepID=A0A6P6C9N0_PTEVA|nr:alpha-N-acetylgalactosaminide alpha-2,6-sialyltransferase 3 isoform X3 [Pteropus vampyrus]
MLLCVSVSTVKRKSVIAVSFIAAFLFLLVVRLVNEVNFPLLLNCFGQPGTKWIPFSYTHRRPLRTHYGYINVRTQEPLQLDCDLCAIVSNSGQMVGQKVGNEIDQSSCIWRMNNAPTKGYEEDVGHMTMIRVVSHTSVPLLLKNPDYFFKEANTTIYVIWGPFRNMRKDGNGIVYNMLKKTVDVYPNAQIYVTTEKRMSYCDGVFKKETGKDSKLALERCGPAQWRCNGRKVSTLLCLWTKQPLEFLQKDLGRLHQVTSETVTAYFLFKNRGPLPGKSPVSQPTHTRINTSFQGKCSR